MLAGDEGELEAYLTAHPEAKAEYTAWRDEVVDKMWRKGKRRYLARGFIFRFQFDQDGAVVAGQVSPLPKPAPKKRSAKRKQ